jgi:formylglycine-generating enzyme required for sulfatase activity
MRSEAAVESMKLSPTVFGGPSFIVWSEAEGKERPMSVIKMKACLIIFLIVLGSFATSVLGQDISDEVRKHMDWGKMALESAKTPADIEESMDQFKQAIKLAPDYADAYYRLGVVQEMVNKDDEAMKNLKKYLELAPDGATVKEAKHLIDKLEYKAYRKEKAIRELGVLIPAGEFMMGGSEANELPQHKVFLDAFYIDKLEVTVAQYRAYCDATGKAMPDAPPWGWQDDLPMGNVTWEDANAYAQYYGKRLPTEAEWEKAARAGSNTKYCFGDSESQLSEYAWYAGNSDNMVHPVGTKKPNVFGLYDMYGNAAEWCSDWYGPRYYKDSPANNPKGPASGPHHAARGGNYGEPSLYCVYSAFRYNFDIASFKGVVRGNWLGFRCASSVKAD